MIDDDYVPIKVWIQDTQTGKIALHPDECFCAHWWHSGNGGCDCNRRNAFPDDDGEDIDHPCRAERYHIVNVEPWADWLTLDEMNQNYFPPKPEPKLTRMPDFEATCPTCGYADWAVMVENLDWCRCKHCDLIQGAGMFFR